MWVKTRERKGERSAGREIERAERVRPGMQLEDTARFQGRCAVLVSCDRIKVTSTASLFSESFNTNLGMPSAPMRSMSTYIRPTLRLYQQGPGTAFEILS